MDCRLRQLKNDSMSLSAFDTIFQGFLVINDFFYKEELDACRRDVGKCVEDLAQALYKAGKISGRKNQCTCMNILCSLKFLFRSSASYHVQYLRKIYIYDIYVFTYI